MSFWRTLYGCGLLYCSLPLLLASCTVPLRVDDSCTWKLEVSGVLDITCGRNYRSHEILTPEKAAKGEQCAPLERRSTGESTHVVVLQSGSYYVLDLEARSGKSLFGDIRKICGTKSAYRRFSTDGDVGGTFFRLVLPGDGSAKLLRRHGDQWQNVEPEVELSGTPAEDIASPNIILLRTTASIGPDVLVIRADDLSGIKRVMWGPSDGTTLFPYNEPIVLDPCKDIDVMAEDNAGNTSLRTYYCPKK